MEPTTPGVNRTGAAMSPAGTRAMTEVAAQMTAFAEVDTGAMMEQRMRYIREADAVGSIPPPLSIKGMVKTGIAKIQGGHPTLLLDKLGESLAYERTGVRLYEALITKYQSLVGNRDEALPPIFELLSEDAENGAAAAHSQGEDAAQTLERIRLEELMHFHMLTDVITALGGDPTSQTPCADVVGTASMGFMQVLTDPRTTMAQCLNTMLAVELTDNAGWELLIQLAADAGQSDSVGQFLGALSAEQEHEVIVRSWLEALVSDRVGSKAV